MGQVLKQGEELRLPPTDLVLGPTARLGLDPDTVQKQIRVSDSNLYASPTDLGSARAIDCLSATHTIQIVGPRATRTI